MKKPRPSRRGATSAKANQSARANSPSGKMRISAGSVKGRSIDVPHQSVRPMRTRIRQALYNIIGEYLAGARMLDIFAGSGALGLEALSRGMRQVTFIETNPAVLKTLRKNIQTLGMASRCAIAERDAYALPEAYPVTAGDALKTISANSGDTLFPVELMTLDPPFGDFRSATCGVSAEMHEAVDPSSAVEDASVADANDPWHLMQQLALSRLLLPGGLIVIEHPSDIATPPPPAGVAIFTERSYGETALLIWRKDPVAHELPR